MQFAKRSYMRAVTGWFATWRWALVWSDADSFLRTSVVTVEWSPGRPLSPYGTQKFYIFGWVFWPQDVFFLAILLIISAYALFFFTAIAGRLWCGYACPQTVYRDFHVDRAKIEVITKRMKLDKAPMSPRKFGIKAAKYAAWIAISLWTGFTLVACFSPLRFCSLLIPTLGFGLGDLWILFMAVLHISLRGGHAEQVCNTYNPYARFQSVMFDPDTLTITYDETRGEPA